MGKKSKKDLYSTRILIFQTKGMKTGRTPLKWLGNRSLHEQYPQLYNIVRKKQDMVAEVLSSDTLDLS